MPQNIELSDVFDKTAGNAVDAVQDAAGAAHSFYTEWRQFALRKNIFDVTVALMVGSALTNITTSLSRDILLPIVISLWSGNNIENMFVVMKEGKRECSGCYDTVEEAQDDGAVTLNYGRFIDSITSFFFTTLVLFFIYKGLMWLKESVEKEEKKNMAGTKI